MKKKCVILKWNPAVSSCNMRWFLDRILWNENEFDWSIYDYRKVRVGDPFFMLKVGVGTCGIVAAGELTSDPEPGEDWSGRGRRVYYADCTCKLMVNPEVLPILECGELEGHIRGFDWHGGHSGSVLTDGQAEVLIQIFRRSLQDCAAVFFERLEWIEKRGMDNDQIYIDQKFLKEFAIPSGF